MPQDLAYEFIPQFSKMLKNLSTILDKAQAFADHKKCEPANLLTDRLAPDQFNFTRQIQLCCDTAKAYAARLTGKEIPKHDDVETTIGQLQDRIGKTIAFLETVKPEDFKGWAERKTLNPRREGKYLPGFDYAMHQAIPNFYFHATTAYAILRTNGLDIGKMDYLGAVNYLPL